MKEKRIANNTYRTILDNGDTVIRLHQTDIIRITKNQDGRDVYTFNSGDWRTATTKDRMNRYSPVNIYSSRGKWLARTRWQIDVDVEESVYFDGLMYSEGKFLNPIPITLAYTSRIRREGSARISEDCNSQGILNLGFIAGAEGE